MHTLNLEWQAVWKIVIASLILGAGLPALFAVGIRSMAYGTGGDAEEHGAATAPGPHPAGQAVGILCFVIVLAVVALGIVFIVATGFGKELSFDHIYPVIQDK